MDQLKAIRTGVLKSDLRGIETPKRGSYHRLSHPLKSDLRGIETQVSVVQWMMMVMLKSDLRGIETMYWAGWT